MQLNPLYDHIIFQFEEKVVNGIFQDTTSFGFILNPSHEFSKEGSRWATIQEVGPTCSANLSKGKRVLVEQGMWTDGFSVDHHTFWRTEEKHILALDE